jgi:hypothetical protein
VTLKFLKRVWPTLSNKRGAQTVEYVAVMAGAALLGIVLLTVMESEEIQSTLKEKVICVITQECNENEVASNKKTDDESSGYIPSREKPEGNDHLSDRNPMQNPASNDNDWNNSWEQTNDTRKSDQKPPAEDEGFFGMLKRKTENAWDGFKEKATDAWEGTKEVASDTWDGIQSGAKAAWNWTVEHKEEIGAGITVAAGVGLLFVPGGQALGAGILIGAAVSGGMAAYNGADFKEIAQAAMVGGLTGMAGGGVGNVVGRGLMAGLSRAASSHFIRTRLPGLAGTMSAGGSESLADDFLHGRKFNWKNAGIAALTAGGMLVGGTLGTLMNATPTGPMAGIKAAKQGDNVATAIPKIHPNAGEVREVTKTLTKGPRKGQTVLQKREVRNHDGEWITLRGGKRDNWTVRMDDGSKVTVKYKNGFPDFSSFSKADMELPKELWFKSDDIQFRKLNKKLYKVAHEDPKVRKQLSSDDLDYLAKGITPDGFTWHHHQEAGRMQLVPTEIHQKSGHTGGREIWGGGSKNR